MSRHYDGVTLFRNEDEEDEFMSQLEALRDEVAYQAEAYFEAARQTVGACLAVAD